MQARKADRGDGGGSTRRRRKDVPDQRAAWAARAAAPPSERVRGTTAAVAASAARAQRRPKPKRRLPPEVLTDDEVRALLDACGRYTAVALRNRALITLMYRAGLRVSEALGLQPKDLDLSNGIVRVLHGKGDRYRAVGLDPGAAAVVAAWIAERGRGQRAAAHARRATPVRGRRSGGRLAREALDRTFEEAGDRTERVRAVVAVASG